MDTILAIKTQAEDLTVRYDVINDVNLSQNIDSSEQDLVITLDDIENRIQTNQQQINKLNKEIDRLTNHADRLDYTIAVASGLICGLIDSFFVGEFSLTDCTQWGTTKVNSFVTSVAQKQGYKGNSLEGAIRYLENKFPIPADSATNIFGGARQHHLRDFSHHPTPIGLLFSLLTQFTGKVYGTNTLGGFLVESVPDASLIGINLPNKISIGIINWALHLVSDMAGSSGTIAAGSFGTGIPGPFVSMLKELSATPFFSHSEGHNNFSVWVSKLFNGTLLSERDGNGKLIRESVRNFDLRAEIGVIHELGKQSIPVLINECIVRTSYFIRRLIGEFKNNEIKSFDDCIHKVNWKSTLPFNNRTIARMISISSGVFVAVDVADATIRAAAKSNGNYAIFAKNMLLRINFVGIGRCAIAISNDMFMGAKKEHKRNNRLELVSENLLLHDVKISILQKDMWVEAHNTEEAIQLMEASASNSIALIGDTLKEIATDLHKIRDDKTVEQLNPNVKSHLLKILKYGK